MEFALHNAEWGLTWAELQNAYVCTLWSVWSIMELPLKVLRILK